MRYTANKRGLMLCNNRVSLDMIGMFPYSPIMGYPYVMGIIPLCHNP